MASDGAVYVFRDPRYEVGMKIGYGGLAKCLSDAQGYAPDGIACEGYWPFDGDLKEREAEAHRALLSAGIACLDLPTPAAPRNGEEWFDCHATAAISFIERRFGPCSPVTRPGRMGLWIMEEFLTGRVKINACSEGYSPRARRRRYSRNGYRAAALLLSNPPLSRATNDRILTARKDLLSRFAADERSARYGWCREAIAVDDVVEAAEEIAALVRWTDDRALDDPKIRIPGMRYNHQSTGVEAVPAADMGMFSEVWWSSAP